MRNLKFTRWFLLYIAFIFSLIINSGCKDKEKEPRSDSWYIEGNYFGELGWTRDHDWFSVGSEAIVSREDSIYILTMNIRDTLPVLIHVPDLHLKIIKSDFPTFYFRVLENPYFVDTGNEGALNSFYTEEGSDYMYSAIHLRIESLDQDSVYQLDYVGTRWY
jgi:hypothetical protein